MKYKNADLEVLKNEYVAGLEILDKYLQKIRLEHKDLYGAGILYQIGLVNKIISGMWESIFEMEKHLPFYRQFYLQRNYERIRKYYLKCQLTYLSESAERDFPENAVYTKLQRSHFQILIQSLLTPRQYEVFYMYFYLNMRKKNIALSLKISNSTVNEHLEKAISKVKASDTCLEFLKNFLQSP